MGLLTRLFENRQSGGYDVLPGVVEPEFLYLICSARQEVSHIRDLLKVWFSRYPISAQADLCGRFRSPDDTPHRSAFFELFLHALFSRLGCQPRDGHKWPGQARNQ